MPEQSSDIALRLIDVSDSMKPSVQYLAVGEDPALLEQLIAKSRQPHILKHTPNDAGKRFKDQAAFHAWYTPDCEMHWLLGPERDLAGIMWYRPKAFPVDVPLSEVPGVTFAIRLYEGYVGHRLSEPFMRLSLRVFVENTTARGETVAGMWLETDTDNTAAQTAYSKLGYQEVFRNEKRAFMILPSAAVRRLASAAA